MSRISRHHARIALGTVLAAGTVLALAVPASAHVSIDPKEVPGGGYATVNVKVPNERDDASTVSVELHLDLDHPVASVMPQAVPGWDVEIETTELDEPLEVHGNQITEVPSRIVWSGGEISPGMFQQFPVSMGRLPADADQLVLKAIQTYDSGEVVRWIEEGEGVDHPAAVLALSAGDGGHGASADSHDTDTDDAGGADADTDSAQDGDHDAGDDGATESAAVSDNPDTTARVLGGVGIAVGALGVAFGLLAGRRRTTDS